MLLFAAHDPGARNHIHPIYSHAVRLGEAAEFVDLSSRKELMFDDQALRFVRTFQPELLISGCSMNQAEQPLIRACKRLGVKVTAMVDISAAGKLNPVVQADFPDCFMVTNQRCKDELVESGAWPEAVVVTGSAHLERISEGRNQTDDFAITQSYGLETSDHLVSFFCNPDTELAVRAVVSLETLLPTTALSRFVIVVRPHPRAEQKNKLESACRALEFVHYDAGDEIDRTILLLDSLFSLAMASTVSLESLTLGTPSAFYQIGWDFSDADRLYINVDQVPRIRTADGLRDFVASVLANPDSLIPDDLENYKGALRRIWDVISALRAPPNAT